MWGVQIQQKHRLQYRLRSLRFYENNWKSLIANLQNRVNIFECLWGRCLWKVWHFHSGNTTISCTPTPSQLLTLFQTEMRFLPPSQIESQNQNLNWLAEKEQFVRFQSLETGLIWDLKKITREVHYYKIFNVMDGVFITSNIFCSENAT